MTRPSDLIAEHRDAIIKIVVQHAEWVEVYGAAARGEDRSGDTLALLVYYRRGATSLHERALKAALEDLLGVRVHLMSGDVARARSPHLVVDARPL